MKARVGVLALAAALGLASAAWAAAKQITDADLDALKIGATTYDQVVAQFGRPVTTERSSDGTKKVSYSVVKTHVKASTYVPVVGLFTGGAVGTSTTDTFEFNSAGVLTKIETSDTAVQCKVFGGCGSAPGGRPAAAAESAPAPASAAPAAVAAAKPPPTVLEPSAPAAAPPAPVAVQTATVPAKPAPAKTRSSCIRVVTDPSQNNC